MKKYFLLLLALGLIIFSCETNDDPISPPETSEEMPEEETPVVKTVADYPVQDFMWRAMNIYYFWQEDVADLADNRFTGPSDPAYVNFLGSSTDPEDFFFNKLCNEHENVVGGNNAVDRFSFLSENYKDIVQGFAGVSKSNGVEFGLGRITDSRGLFGFVRYIVKGSDADTKDIKRGDIFIGVNGTDLTIDNYRDLLFGEEDTYTLNFATLANGTIAPNGRELSLTKQEGLVENPILVNQVIEHNGIKVGYMVYNQFAGNSGEPLNEAFGELKAQGINELVLDLRYNPGGFGYITQILGSLIYEANPDKVFYNRRFNSRLEEAWDVVGGDKTNFVADTGTNDGNSNIPLNSLNLSKVYIIATRNSASASELLMNGLRPYVEVVHIGERTVGKNQGSLTLVDSPSTGFGYDRDREDEINPDNQWAIQPIVSQTENSEGFGDYSAGLVPNVEISEDLSQLGSLGDPNERLFARALEEIDASTSKKDFTSVYPVDLFSSSSLQKAKGGELIFKNIPLISKQKADTGTK
ncbi:carboxyl-terminal protease [Maribacter algarum]|uniref:Carboxyl-terminal protease n=1 Tax=Maribacter algarum (ex Zhang et al. 2020) TaxID=2578118 RepID=A0A5S3PMN0_9FLAO|nr:S41 family peptidase [Maribacter algarum]TMM53676.1 carboxyl-terminal protease [Maribacter algarum]